MIDKIHFGSYYGSFYRRTQLFMRELFKKFELNFADGVVLIFVCENPGVIQETIAYRLSLDKAAVARSLKLLENLGLLTRNIDENNQRTKLVCTTAKADSYKTYFDKGMIIWNDKLMQDLSDAEKEVMMAAMSKMRESAITVDIEQLLKTIK